MSLLGEWHEREEDWGDLYLEYAAVTPRDRVFVEDRAVTMLINSQVGAGAARSVCRNGDTLDLSLLPDKSLEETTAEEREIVASTIASACWPGIGASIATKTLHKKRPALIPVLDNRAKLGAYMNPLWPEVHSGADGTKNVLTIRKALDWIATDLSRTENASVWPQLQKIEPGRSRIELFDMVWWIHFRRIEPQ